MSSGNRSIEQVIAQLLEAVEEERALDFEALVRAHPEFESELREFYASHQHLSQTAPSQAGGSLQGHEASLAEDGLDATLHTPNTSDYSASRPPKFLGDYEILEEIDRGGMGVVYRAKHLSLNRVVALKVIRSGELANAEEVARFSSEAKAAAALTHPGIVPIFEVGAKNGLVFYTMAYIEGRSLADLVADGPMDPLQAVRLVGKICAAVQFAHDRGVYHRDLKPANVLVNDTGQPIIIDFGLAKVLGGAEAELTATGQLLGTPAYMAPEIASGRTKGIGPQPDVYALGAILYYLCTGQPAFSGPTPFDVLLQVLDRRPPKPSRLNKSVSKAIDFVCLKGLEKSPQARYSTAREMADDLNCILAEQPLRYPDESLTRLLKNWWQREPILVAHVIGIDVTLLILVLAYYLRGEHATVFYYRLALLSFWLLVSFFVQRWVNRANWRSFAIYTWLTTDVVIFTSLISFAGPPRSMLLIGFPMVMVASALFYQRRYLVVTTALSIVGFCLLWIQYPDEDFGLKPDFSAIFLTGLIVIALSLLAMINRVRGLSRFHHD